MELDFNKIRTQTAFKRSNQVRLSDLRFPSSNVNMDMIPTDLLDLAKRIKRAKEKRKSIILFMGAHVIKCGLSPYVIELLRHGFVSHIAGNGAVSIHDFELSYLGATSEDVPCAIEDGSFGMWEETGGWMNAAISENAKMGYGYSIAKYIDEHTENFPYRKYSILYSAYKKNIPSTIHVTIGADIIHQHPKANFAAIGMASGKDFHKICESVSQLEDGVFLNFGSAVTGAEVFLKALSIARNLGFAKQGITTANFDLKALGDYKKGIGYDNPDYYYRPRKNIINRPTQNRGKGYHFELNHSVSLPMLHFLLVEKDGAHCSTKL